MEWYYGKHGKQEGPVDLARLQEMLRTGQLAPNDLVWRQGMTEWAPASSVPELSQPQPAPPAAPGAGPPAPETGAGGSYGPASRAAATQAQHEHVPNYLVPAILVTILCCWPFGIPAIVFAAKVDGLVARGQIAEAHEASQKAKMWSTIAGVSGFVIVVLYVILMATGILSQR